MQCAIEIKNSKTTIRHDIQSVAHLCMLVILEPDLKVLCIETWFQALAPKSKQHGVTPTVAAKDLHERAVHCKGIIVGTSMLKGQRMTK